MTKRDEEIIEQLEAIKKELKEGKQQSASTIAVNSNSSSLSFGHFLKWGFRKWSFKIIGFLVVLLLVGTLIGTGAFYFFSGAKGEIEKGSLVEQMKDLSSLATSQAYVKAIIEKEDNQLFGKEISANIPGTKRKLLLVVPGTVTAGIDLQGIQEHDVIINEEEKTMKITIPRAEIIQEPTLDFDEVQTFSVEGIFRQEVDWDEGYDLADEAQALVKEEALSQGLLELAEKNAEKTLIEFFSQMGFEVSIQYKD